MIRYLGLDRAHLLGCSLGGGAALWAAIQHPGLVRRLAVVSAPARRDGWFPEVRVGMDQLSSAGYAELQQSPMFEAWSAVAPDAVPRR